MAKIILLPECFLLFQYFLTASSAKFFSIKCPSMQSKNKISLPDKIISVTDSLQKIPDSKMRKQLVTLINELISQDFSALVRLLYRIDVDEKKIRLSLDQMRNKDSALILADLIIERQLQKIESRKHFNGNRNDDDGEEKW